MPFRYEVKDNKCLDCGRIFRTEVPVGRVTGISYKCREERVDPGTCQHTNFSVDESTAEPMYRENFGGFMIRFFTGPAFEGVQYTKYLQAHATCNRCDTKVYVQSDIKKKWRDLELLELPVKWSLATEEIPINTTEYRKQVRLVK